MTTRQVITGIVAGLVLTGSAIAIIRQLRPRRLPPMPVQEWYYDLNTGRLFAGPAGLTPPIEAPSGPAADGALAGARALVYGCGGCDESQRYIGYLEIYAPEIKQRLAEMRERDRSIDPPRGRGELSPAEVALETALRMGAASLIKRVDDPDWVPISSDEGQRIVREALRHCGVDQVPQTCFPDR